MGGGLCVRGEGGGGGLCVRGEGEEACEGEGEGLVCGGRKEITSCTVHCI